MKKIITLFTVFALLSNVCVFAENDSISTYNEKRYIRAAATVEFLAGDDFFVEPTKSLTRGMFAETLYKLYLPVLGTSDNAKPYFTDVAENHKAFTAIQTMCEAGIISEAEKFNPEAEITYNEAVKMVTVAGGYSRLAEVYGGYPEGYLSVARDIELTKGVSNPANLTAADGAILLFNSLFAPTVVQTTKGIHYDDSENNQLSRLYDGLYACEGVVTQTEYNSYILNADVSKNNIKINGESFSTNIEISPDLLGKQTFAICDQDTNTVELIVETENEEISIAGKDFEKIQGDKFIYNTDGKESRKSLDDLYIVLYNGRRIANLTQSLVSENGTTITLLDNDDDDEFEIIKVESSVSGTVDSVDYEYGKIAISTPEKATFNFDPDKSYLRIYDAEGNEMALEEVSKDSVVEIQSSQDGMIAEIYVLSNTVNGKYTAWDKVNGCISIDGTIYEVSSAFENKYLDTNSILMNKELEVFLNRKGVVVALISNGEDFTYGYLQRSIFDNSEGDDELYIQIFTVSGESIRYTTSKKVRIDGTRKTLSQASAILGGLTDKFIRYSLNKDNEIASIDIADTYDNYITSNPTYEFGDSRPEEDSLLLYKDMTTSSNAQYRTAFNGFAGYALLNGTPIFFIPSDDEDTDKYDDWRIYSVSDLPGNSSYDWKAYDIKSDGTAGAVVIRYSDLSVFNRQYGSFICESVAEAVMPNGDIGKMLVGYNGSEYKTYYLSAEVEEKFNEEYPNLETAGFAKGDIYRISVSGDNIVDINIDFEYLINQKYAYRGLNGSSDTYFTNDLTSGYGFHTTGSNAYLEGSVYSINGDYAYIGMTKDIDSIDGSIYNYTNMRLVKLPTQAVVYNRERGFVRPVDIDRINTYIGSGTDAAHVIMRFNDTRPQFMVIVE